MKKTELVAFTAALMLGTSGIAMAQSSLPVDPASDSSAYNNVAWVDQLGSGGSASQTQNAESVDNSATITQLEDSVGAVATQTQSGALGVATITQSGNANAATQTQTGWGEVANTATIEQNLGYAGGNNVAEQVQLGMNNAAVISQTGSGSTAYQTQSGASNTATTMQSGSYNDGTGLTLPASVTPMTTPVYGSYIEQIGVGNNVTHWQDADNAAIITVQNNGNMGVNGNFASATQYLGADGSLIEQYQVGDENDAYAEQAGPGNYTLQNQVGSFNTAWAGQAGSGNVIEQDQGGDGNYALARQLGSDNVIMQTQSSDYNEALAYQEASASGAEIYQTQGGFGGNYAYAIQTGAGWNSITQTQLGAQSDYAYASQSGVGNIAMQTQN